MSSPSAGSQPAGDGIPYAFGELDLGVLNALQTHDLFDRKKDTSFQ
ncbi:MAG: hypothetical protein WCB99_12870 [Candidatus Cybelea sp.]